MTELKTPADWVRKCAEVVMGWDQCSIQNSGNNGILLIGRLGACRRFDPLGEGSNDCWRIVEKFQSMPNHAFEMATTPKGNRVTLFIPQSDGTRVGHSVYDTNLPDCLKPYGIAGLLVFAAVKLLGGEDGRV